MNLNKLRLLQGNIDKILVFDPASKTLKEVTQVTINGEVIQITTEKWWTTLTREEIMKFFREDDLYEHLSREDLYEIALQCLGCCDELHGKVEKVIEEYEESCRLEN